MRRWAAWVLGVAEEAVQEARQAVQERRRGALGELARAMALQHAAEALALLGLTSPAPRA